MAMEGIGVNTVHHLDMYIECKHTLATEQVNWELDSLSFVIHSYNSV